MFVPVKTNDGQQLMPMHAARARKLVKRGEATPYWNNGVYCVRLNKEPSDRETQDIVVGVDPGSKKEGFTVKSATHTYLNVQADAHNKVGKKVEKRRELRRGRGCPRWDLGRSRKCPNRKNRTNKGANRQKLPAGTRARWDWKLRILDWLSDLYPVTKICVEDIKARTKPGKKRWNTAFSPLEVGKRWFVSELIARYGVGNVFCYKGRWTSARRKALGLEKSQDKLSDDFYAHCVDSWVMAHSVVNGDTKKAMALKPDNTAVFCISPIPVARRNLHREQPAKGGIRSRYGGTVLGNGLVKNTVIKHSKHGITRPRSHRGHPITGINAKGVFSIYSLEGQRLTTGAKRTDFQVLTRLNFQYRSGVSSPC